jgi:membrane associated rhomboid family serine protease
MSYQQISTPRGFDLIPPVVKNLLIINVLFYLGTIALASYAHIDLVRWLGLHSLESPNFQPIQLVSHMFMHGGTMHILFNMFALWMFGTTLENFWGGKRFLIYYMVTGLGAAAMQMAVNETQIFFAAANMSAEQVRMVQDEGLALLLSNRNYIDPLMGSYNMLINTPMVGASGAVFGLLLAFGMMFPNSVIYLYFAIPIKAKYFVILYGLFELFAGVRNSAGDNVAHFAHLGGMFFGFFLIQYWKKHPTRFS